MASSESKEEAVSPERFNMQIDVRKPLAGASSSRSADENDSAGYQSDIDFFGAALSASPASASRSQQAGLPNLLEQASVQLDLSKKRMSKGLQALSKGNNEKLMLDYPRMLSNTVLTTQVLVKGLGSTVQLVEKISNLQ
ncbi:MULTISPECIES: type III secretion apparatus protein RspB [unclassified Pseudomonas]|uniref:type III secretion apparatus protein RspB n=1 Tax=unclassified Pseudomonas TaxID=196821 RepID=UPI001F2ECA53|nr:MULTISPECIES: type III secretion apparatus protein RspB [unclassified Pseudomonas]